ncbi:RNA-directed DNA polymerase, eukaryota, reverse transcriptase zinc-binding domain protein [Tanacetum coccineum]
MGDSDWQAVSRKNCRSVFERLNPSQSQRSNSDDLAKISLSVYVSNFLSHLTERELWNIYGKVGTIVDVYIAKRKNQLNQMFAFYRYIKVSNSKSLIDSLSNTWIGKLHLHANVARFDRKAVVKPSHVGGKAEPLPLLNQKGGTNVVNDDGEDSNLVLELQSAGTNDFPLAILGCYKDFRSMANTLTLCHSEGFLDVDIKYLGGLWILFYFNSMEVRDKFLNNEGISQWFASLKPWHDDFLVEERLWGGLLFSDDFDTCNRLSKRWTPSFVGEDSYSDDENSLSKFNHEKDEEHKVNDVESVADTDFGNAHFKVDEDTAYVLNNSKLEHVEPQVVDIVDSDPFGLEPLINKKRNMDRDVKGSLFLVHDHSLDWQVRTKSGSWDSVSHGTSQKLVGFSLIERIEETIKVRMALGLNMDGCRSTLAALIANNGEFKETKIVRVNQWMLHQVWGNSQFDFVSMSARGLWISNNINIMWIVVYAPQTLSSKIAVWDALANIILNWNGILVAMGDFNEVREASERFGSSFNVRQRYYLTMLSLNTSLIDVPLGSLSPHITGVILEKGVPDHRPILIKEHVADFGPTPFRFFHSWLQLEGFHSLVVDTWSNDGIVDANGFNSSNAINLKKEHLSCLTSIDIKIDQGIANETDLFNRRDSIHILEDLDKREISDIAKKARVKWAMEGDENSQFFHATDEFRSHFLTFVQDFFCTPVILKGCNSSFIALIPKVSNATLVTDFRPISLIGCQYKIIGKILANRLSKVIGSCISSEQSAFIKGRNILDGPLVLNEVIWTLA